MIKKLIIYQIVKWLKGHTTTYLVNMFNINIGTIDVEHQLGLSENDIKGLSPVNQQTILELIGYRNGSGLFPWGYIQLISDLRQLYKQ